MTDEIKEDLNGMTFFVRNTLGFNKEYNLKLYDKIIKQLENYTLEDYLKYYFKKNNDDELKDEKINEIMEKKEMIDEEISKEDTKIDLKEENQDIIYKIFLIKKFEKEKKLTLYSKKNNTTTSKHKICLAVSMNFFTSNPTKKSKSKLFY